MQIITKLALWSTKLQEHKYSLCRQASFVLHGELQEPYLIITGKDLTRFFSDTSFRL